INPIVYLYSK
ncbi:hypothetical protein, partial [Plasmodium yoelii yoelii]